MATTDKVKRVLMKVPNAPLLPLSGNVKNAGRESGPETLSIRMVNKNGDEEDKKSEPIYDGLKQSTISIEDDVPDV